VVETNEIIEIDLNHIGGNVIYKGIPTIQKLDRRSSIDDRSVVIPRSYIDHLKEGTMNSGKVKDVRTINLTDDDDDDDTSGNQNGNMEWKKETIFHFQHPPSV
jgi:hypothetical protein